jgi:hypothetical protein
MLLDIVFVQHRNGTKGDISYKFVGLEIILYDKLV